MKTFLNTTLVALLGSASVAALLVAGPGRLGAGEPALTGDRLPTSEGDLVIHPVNHASLVLGWKTLAVHVDPVGPAARYTGLPRPDVILLTDIHGDHLSAETLKALATAQTRFVAPPAVAAQLPADWQSRTTVLTNGQTAEVSGLRVEAIPMSNLAPDRLKFHSKGRGNGYVLTLGDKRAYLSGDTEDIPEMRALRNIDVAFLCMNLPYTMNVEQAASAVRAFRPKVVYPYHCRGSDVEEFKRLVGAEAGVEVRLRDWYGR